MNYGQVTISCATPQPNFSKFAQLPPPKKIIALFTDFDDLGHVLDDFSQRFRIFRPYGSSSSDKKDVARKVSKSCFLATSKF